MPDPATFTPSEAYFATLFHELIHATGHPKRLDRLTAENGVYGSEPYGKEELIAEIGNAFLCALTGIENQQTTEQAVGYIQNWMEQIKADNTLIFSAASAAQKAVDYITNRQEGGTVALMDEAGTTPNLAAPAICQH